MLDRAGARVIAFDLLFAEPEEAVSAVAARGRASRGRAAPRAAGRERCGQASRASPRMNRTRDFAASPARERQGAAAGRLFARLRDRRRRRRCWRNRSISGSTRATSAPLFPLQPTVGRAADPARWPRPPPGSAMSPLPSTATARRATTISPCRSMPISCRRCRSAPPPPISECRGAMSALRSATASSSATVLVPTDPAMRLVVNYRGPRGTIPTYSFVDLVEGKLDPGAVQGPHRPDRRLVYRDFRQPIPAPFDNTPMPGTERLANDRRHDPGAAISFARARRPGHGS